jgi:ABC-type transporter Mla MlaB component
MTAVDGIKISPPAGDWQDVPVGGQGPVPAAWLDLAPGDHHVFDDGALRIRVTSSPPGLALAGEVDEFSFPNLLNALEMITDGLAPVHVDLGGLVYCDVAGLRAIVRLTEPNSLLGDRSGARRVYLHGAPPHVRAVLHILRWDSTPGLALC